MKEALKVFLDTTREEMDKAISGISYEELLPAAWTSRRITTKRHLRRVRIYDLFPVLTNFS